MNGHLQNVRLSWTEAPNRDGLIVGQESGSATRHVGGAGQAPPHSIQKTPPLNFQNDTVRTSMIRVRVSAATARPANGKPPLTSPNEVRDPIGDVVLDELVERVLADETLRP